MNRKLNEVNEELRRTHSKNTSLQRDLDQANKAINEADSKVKSAKNKAQEADRSHDLIKKLELTIKVKVKCHVIAFLKFDSR